ncbi:MAG: hypothetical protein ACOCG6_01545 [Candidatus Cloacimonadaceae bacterium]
MKKMLLIVLLMLSVGWVFATTTPSIGSGTETQPNAPFNFNNTYGWSKNIYTYSELEAAGITGDVYIDKISFTVDGTDTYANDRTNQTVWIRSVSYDDYGMNENSFPDISSLTPAFSGTIPIGAGVSEIVVEFTEPYLWTHSSNNNLESYGKMHFKLDLSLPQISFHPIPAIIFPVFI